jgi:hypothetical protein
MKTLKQVLEAKSDKPEPTSPIEPDSITALVPKTKDEKRFMDKHVVQKVADRNGNGDDVFRASNINYSDRTPTRHGYNPQEDQKVYEEKGMKTLVQILGEKHLTPAEKKKREDIAQAMERDNPGMDKSKKMAIATAQAKKVAEEVLDERVKTTHEDPLVTVHDKDGLHTHANLSVANNIFGTKVKHTDVHAGKTKAKNRDGDELTFAISKHHAAALKEDVELNEAARHEQYATYHAGVKDMLKKLGAHVDAHKEAAMAPTEWNKEKGGNMHSGHVYAMKNLHRTLQDMHDGLQQDVEYAQPPKPIKMKEEVDLFECFNDSVREQVKQVFDLLDDTNKQTMIEMIESEEYDSVVEIVQEVLNA